MKNRLINKNNNILKKQKNNNSLYIKGKKTTTEKKKKFYRIFLTAILPTKNNKKKKKTGKTRPNLVGLRCKSRLQMVKIKYKPIRCKNNVLLLFLQDFVGRIAVR